MIQPQDPDAELFDTTGLDFSQIPGFIAAAKEQSGITHPDSVIVIVNRSGVADAAGEMPVRRDGAPRLAVRGCHGLVRHGDG